MHNMVSFTFKFLPVLAIMLLAACAEPLTPEEAVRQRAQGWMDALLEKDVAGAYRYTSPNYRQFASAGRYNARVAGASNWDAGSLDAITCEQNVCTVIFIVEYEIKKMGIQSRRPMEYRWVEIEGEWWLYVPAK